jgi:predicted RNase H-like nuclease (RuvC/YqgF family)
MDLELLKPKEGNAKEQQAINQLKRVRFPENALMDELQKTVADLVKHNQSLKSENYSFKEEIAALQSLLACCHAKSQQQLVRSFETSIPSLVIQLGDCRRCALSF